MAGVLLGGVPFAGVGEQILDASGVLPDSTPEARLGLAVGQVVGGLFETAGGIGGTSRYQNGSTGPTGITHEGHP